MQLERLSVNGLEALRMAEHDLEVVVLPGLGAKLKSLRWHDLELLAQNPRKPLLPARYAVPYAVFDASGFDECLPTVGACPYPNAPLCVGSTPNLRAEMERLRARLPIAGELAPPRASR